MMNTDSRIRINVPNIAHETIDGEIIILNLSKGNYYSLVGIGADTWCFIENNASVGHIIKKISENYQGDRKEIEVAINDFILELEQEGIVTLNNENNPESDESLHVQIKATLKENKPAFKAPELNKYTDMQDLLLLDPIHDVDDEKGWPTGNPDSSLKNQ